VSRFTSQVWGPQPPTLTRRRLLTGAGALVLAAVLPLAKSARAGGSGATHHAVAIEGLMFKPAQLSVKRGDRITWANNDLFPHTVTADGVFDSQDIAVGKSWSYVAERAGTYAYRCKLHPTMTARLIVT
jgi:plastocyanin